MLTRNLYPPDRCPPGTSRKSVGPCTSNIVENQQNEQTTSFGKEVWTVCDLETQQLREMFPTCLEKFFTEALERCATVDAAVDYVVSSWSDQASMQLLM